MCGRFHPLISPALLVWGILFFPTGIARAHRLDAQAFLLPGQKKVQIESWFDDGHIPRGAKVQVFRGNGQVLAEGDLNQEGIFIFSFTDPETLKVVISAGSGHRKELEISEATLATSLTSRENQSDDSLAGPKEKAPIPLAQRESGLWIKDVFLGVGFLLALAAFVLSLRNYKTLQELTKKVTTPRPGGL
jgi:nickel transport protein